MRHFVKSVLLLQLVFACIIYAYPISKKDNNQSNERCTFVLAKDPNGGYKLTIFECSEDENGIHLGDDGDP
ncbi:hypothetical protein BJV82DRAFT_276556 [Fennellomyces sp. T-0311]|nr:hypothetical protein BJV82DRAFT_276556 [Fennellomyces sp. T-0311]